MATISIANLRAGPFISATSHTVLELGQRPVPFGGSADEGGELGSLGKKSAKQQGKKGRGSTTLKDLVENGLIKPGRNKITVNYKGITYTASLQKDGVILYRGKKFNSATSFSIFCKRLQTPNKQGDDGWKSVLYEGLPLEHYRKKLSASLQPAEDEEQEGLGLAEDGADDPAAATDQWVSCDRCRTWRVVPNEEWPSVKEDSREDWLCEYATWDVSKYAPFKPPCT